MRARKPANIAYDLERFSQAIIGTPQGMRTCWREFVPQASSAAATRWREVRLDLGCGKGAFLVAAAQAEPDVLFLGADSNETCVARAAEKILAAGLPNAAVMILDAADIAQAFGPAELSRIYLNFNSPFPKRKYAQKRLTHVTHLLAYRHVLARDGVLDLRTDNVLYWHFSLGQLGLAHYAVVERCDNLHEAHIPGIVLASEYDDRTVSRGARVRWLIAQAQPLPPDLKPEDIVQTLPESLVDYLPEDIESFDEIPYGMEDTLENMRNRLTHCRARGTRFHRHS